MGPEAVKEAKAEFKEQMEQGRKELKKQLDEQKADYEKYKEAKDAAAFKVMDVNGDGTLCKKEFVDALTPDTAKNNQFLKELGFDVEAACMAGKPNMQMQGDCSQM